MRPAFVMLLAFVGAGWLACTPEPRPGLRMPEPIEWRVPLPNYTEEQLRHYDEVQAFLVEHYKGYAIAYTTQNYSGDIIDWVDPASVEGSQVEAPPPISDVELELSPGVELQKAEMDAHPELRELPATVPAGAIPMVRPSFEDYILGQTDAGSFEEFLVREEGGRTDGVNRLYAGWTTVVDNWGGGAQISHYAGAVEQNSFSLTELAVSCDGPDKTTTLELVGIVASQDRKNFGNDQLRVQVEFFSQGVKYGDGIGGWHGRRLGFVPLAGAPYAPGTVLEPVSTPGGAQHRSVLKILYFFGGWWLAHNGNWLGYYPFDLFDLIGTGACEISYYGEVLDTTPADWTHTDMGSGEFADKGDGYAGHISKMTYYEPTTITPMAPQNFGSMGPKDAKCYTASVLFTDVVNGVHFYYGGPGGDAPGCD